MRIIISVRVFSVRSSQSSLIGFASWMLGHADLESQAIAYQSLVLRPQPKLKLFQLGKELKVKSREESKDRKPTKLKQEVQ